MSHVSCHMSCVTQSSRDRQRRAVDSSARQQLKHDQEIVKELRAAQEAEAAEVAVSEGGFSCHADVSVDVFVSLDHADVT